VIKLICRTAPEAGPAPSQSQSMPRLLQQRLEPASRRARLMFSEYGVAVDLEDFKPWTRDPHLL